MFDLTINLGNILTIVSFLLGGTFFVLSLKTDSRLAETRLDMLDGQFEGVKAELKKLTEVVVEQTRQSGRIDRVEDRQMAQGKRLDELQKSVEVIKDFHLSTRPHS